MELNIFQVDAFTNEIFKGNPAAVIPLTKWLPVDVMQAIANENNLSETAFFVPTGDKGNYELRWFTPVTEVDLCGHATLAASHVLFSHLGFQNEKIHFITKSGELTVSSEGKYYIMNFPANPPEKTDPNPLLLDALGLENAEMFFNTDYLVIVNNEEIVKSLSPDFNRLKEVKTRGVIVTAESDDYDFISRFFAPAVGINEDPVTGSAHTLLSPYWAEKLNKDNLRAAQLSKRGGEIICNLIDDRVELKGKAATYMKGIIFTED